MARTLVGSRIRDVDASLGVLTFEGEVGLGVIEGFSEESLGQSAARGNFSEPDQSWTHFGSVPVAATSSAYDGLVLGTLDQKASVGVYVLLGGNRPAVVLLMVVPEEGPVAERNEERLLGLLGGCTTHRVAGGCCGWLGPVVTSSSLVVGYVLQQVKPEVGLAAGALTEGARGGFVKQAPCARVPLLGARGNISAAKGVPRCGGADIERGYIRGLWDPTGTHTERHSPKTRWYLLCGGLLLLHVSEVMF